MTDEEIVSLYLSRDESAISQTRDKYGCRLRAVSYNILRDSGASEECENDSYMAAWGAIPPAKPVNCLYAFLARIIRNLSLNRLRDSKRIKRSGELVCLSDELEELISSPDDTECEVESRELAHLVSGFLRALPEKKRLIFLRRYWYTDSTAELAKRFGMSESNVKTTLCRIRAELKKYLEKEGISL